MAPLVPFSEQLRKVIEECGTSRYALCQRSGVSEAVLSRFLSGKQGLRLVTLDKLGAALGLVLTAPIQLTPRRQPRGRKPQKGKEMSTTPGSGPRQKFSWPEFAEGCAKDACENHFPSRRGVWYIQDLNVLVIYNNNPYDRNPGLRDGEVAEFRRRLLAEGLKELAYATYPPPGAEDEGYTFAMVIDAGRDREEWVVDTWKDVLCRSPWQKDRAAPQPGAAEADARKTPSQPRRRRR
jgi:transcriptional regulator with XRE-family HTH domain